MKKPIVLFLLLTTFLNVACEKNAKEKVYTSVIEGSTIQVPSLTGGKIIDLRVDSGQKVEHDDTLAVMDTTDFVLQLQQINSGLKELQIQKQIIKTSLNSAETDLAYIKQKYERIKSLVESQSVPKQTLDDLENKLEKARSARKTAIQNAEKIAAKREQLIAQKQTFLKKINDCVITAPDKGTIYSQYFELGEAVPPMNPILEIIHLNTVDVKIYIAEKLLPTIKHGQSVTIRVDGLEKNMDGKIRWVSPEAEFTPKTILTPETRSSLVYAVKISIPNPKGILKHGMPVEVVL